MDAENLPIKTSRELAHLGIESSSENDSDAYIKMAQVQQSRRNELDARACARPYLILGSIFLLLTLLTLLGARNAPAHDWTIACIPAGFGIAIMLWLSSIRLKVGDGELSYQTIFGIHSIRLTDIENVENKLIATSRGSYRALVIHPQSHKKPIRINIKHFSREDLRKLFDLLSPVFDGPRTIGVYSDETV